MISSKQAATTNSFAPWSMGKIVLFALMTTGCSSLNTAYQPPVVTLPDTFANQSTTLNTPQVSLANQFWNAFNDKTLSELIETALRKNSNLAQLALKLQQVRLQADLADSQKLPSVNAKVNASDSKNIANGVTNKNFSANLATSFELDLFNKLSQQSNVAQFEATATAQDLQAARIALVSTVSELYWQLKYNQQVLSNQRINIETSQKLYQIVQAQYQAGAVSGLEVAQAKQALLATQSSAQSTAQQISTNQHQLALLLDNTQLDAAYSDLISNTTLLQSTVPEINAGVPASALAHRPDLIAAELRLQKAVANTNATKASYSPDLSLTGALGFSSTALSNLLKNPIATLGAGISLPFLQYKDMQRNVKISELSYASSIIGYRQALYQAFSDVDNALTNKEQLANQWALNSQTLAQAKTVEKLSTIRYNAGATALKNVLDAQTSRINAETQLVQTRLNQLNNTMLILKSIAQ